MLQVTSVPALTAVASYQTKTNIIDPTARLHGAFIVAFDFFNEELFQDRLPRCMITLRANRSSLGYFAQERFKEGSSEKVIHEIALNPKAFKNRSVEDVLSTLVHEMVHLEQQCFGKPSRGRYHNKQWGTLMKRVGLYPSDTAEPGGKETGQSVSHYIIEGGPFSIACSELLKTGFTIEYADIWRESERKEPENSKGKYSCNTCSANAWAKPKSNLVCGDCLAKVLQQIGASAEVIEAMIKIAGLGAVQ
jgi:predicted SprT family Zn-dependent metalloprotease